MRELFFIIATEKKMIRDYAIAAVAIIGLALLGTHGVQAAAEFLNAERAPRPAPQAQNAVKTYTITRSVLDDNPATGSIQSLNQVRFDPCKK
jgi:hypothetical protein